ncbi:MAG: Methyl-accepting chemotaxis protein mcpA [Frankiales bacterium]|nr:Methyl-accepting chemotaxis protein mcpA [Frankiales bacterium]
MPALAPRRLRFADRPLRTRLLLPVGVGAACVLLLGVTAARGQSALAGDADALLRDSQVLSNHLTGDMMHDALRADVLSGLLARTPAEHAAARAAVEEHAATFLEMQDANAGLVRDAGVLRTLEEGRPALEAYVEQARQSTAAAGAVAAASLPAFVEAFDTLAASQEALTEQVAAVGAAHAEAAHERAASSRRTLLLVGLVALLLMLGLGALAVRSVVVPVRRLQGRLARLAADDLSAAEQAWDADEVGDMGRALEQAQASLRTTVLALGESATELAGASEEVATAARGIAAGADETATRSDSVSASAEQVSRNVQTLASGAEEMGASIREIAGNAYEAAQVGGDAVAAAAATTDTVRLLGESSREIGEVVRTITGIAEQTNLLALNATIEAARAGESGKGFAVVANEVKELARETALATKDIGRRVQAIQAGTAGAVDAIAGISDVVARMNDYATTIASAVEEQTATTAEMTRNVSEAATGSGDRPRGGGRRGSGVGDELRGAGRLPGSGRPGAHEHPARAPGDRLHRVGLRRTQKSPSGRRGS